MIRSVIVGMVLLVMVFPAGISTAAEDRYAGDEKEIRWLLDRWLTAQNSGDFDAYQTCYASRFQGVRRTGNRTLAFDRAGWMKDRGKMFKKPMFVRMDNAAMKINPGSVLVRFEQTWASGSYKDKGPKEMLLVKEGGSWKIAREELLQSNVLAESKKSTEKIAPAPGGFSFRFVRVSGPDVFHVIFSDPPDEYLPSDNVVLEGDDAVRPVWLGGPMRNGADLLVGEAATTEKYRFFTAQGKACEAKLRERVELVSLETPHFSVRDGLRNGSMTKEEYAQSVWTNGNKVVAVHVEEAACRGKDIRWAQPASAKGAAAKQEVADEATHRTALRKFRELSSYAEVQTRYTKETGEKGTWDDNASTSVAAVWSSAGNPKEKTVSLFVSAGSGCGGGFAGQLWALWRVDAGGAWIPVGFGEKGQEFSLVPAYALDVNGDGVLEWVAEQFPGKYYFLRMEGNSLTTYTDLQIPYHDCPC